MSFESITDERLAELRGMPKRITNPNSKRKAKYKHEEVNYLAVNANAAAPEEATARFTVYVRQSVKDSEDFSCGISWIAQNGEVLTLAVRAIARANALSMPCT